MSKTPRQSPDLFARDVVVLSQIRRRLLASPLLASDEERRDCARKLWEVCTVLEARGGATTAAAAARPKRAAGADGAK